MQHPSSAEYAIDDDPARIDLDVVWSFLAHEAYWARWRTRDDVVRQVQGAWRVVGAYHRQEMVGFARAISDEVALAYLADVFVLPEHRRRGLGRSLVHVMIDKGPGAGFRWLLHTADAHTLYAAFGFAAPDSTLLERPGTRPPVLPEVLPPLSSSPTRAVATACLTLWLVQVTSSG